MTEVPLFATGDYDQEKRSEWGCERCTDVGGWVWEWADAGRDYAAWDRVLEFEDTAECC